MKAFKAAKEMLQQDKDSSENSKSWNFRDIKDPILVHWINRQCAETSIGCLTCGCKDQESYKVTISSVEKISESRTGQLVIYMVWH